jgi:type VI secretion system protein ImpH
MAAESRRTAATLIEVLHDEAYRFDFFQAVRLLERSQPDKLPVGRSGSVPSREIARFRTHPSLRFAPSQLHQITTKLDPDATAPAAPEVMVAFMGLIGPLGVLPVHYTELVAERVRYKDTALWEFLDIFDHRMISLFYRAWEKYNFPVAYERGEQELFTECLFDLIGMGTRGLRDQLEVPNQALLFYGGLIAQRPHSASAVAAMVSDYFQVKATFEPFTGQWLKLDDESICKLGLSNSTLGVSTIAGSRIWDSQSKFRIRIGPLKHEQFRSFLPTEKDFKSAVDIVRYMVGLELDFDFQLILKKNEVPGCILTTRARRRPMLGWTTWLKTNPFVEDDSQVVLSTNN